MTTTTSRPARARARRTGRTSLLAEALARPMADYYLVLVPTILLLGIGQLMVLSSSSLYSEAINNSPYSIAGKQVLYLLVGIPIGAWLSRCGDAVLHKLSWAAMGLSLALLVLVLLIGSNIKGNQAWLILGPVSIQPSEFAKISLIVFLAQMFSVKERVLDRPKELVPAFLGFGLIILLVLAEKDLGTAIIIFAIFMVALWVVGIPLRVMLGVVVLGAATVGVLIVTSANRMARIFSFLGDGNDPYASQQPLSSVYALASGGWWGLGLGESRQKWGALADGAQNDFIFAVLGEELGLVGVTTLLALFFVLCWAGFRIAMRSATVFRRVLAAGCTSWIAIQAMMNIGVAMRVLPVVGVPLPFVSAGGSALLACMLAVGILLSCAREEPEAVRARAAAAKGDQPRKSAVVESR